MNSGLRLAAVLLAALLPAGAQTLNNATLTGKYFARHIEITTDASNNVTDARSITGSMQFSGTGSYTFTGQQVIGTGTPAAFTATGTYKMTPAGAVTLTNPQKPTLSINARYSAEAVAGSSTEAQSSTFDLFIAVPAPKTALTNASVSGTWYAADLELTNASLSQVRNSFLTITADGAGNFSSIAARGHAANFNSGNLLTQNFSSTYSIAADGTGTMTLAGGIISLPSNVLSSAPRVLQLSATGNVLLGATPGAHDVLIAIKGFAGTAANSSLATYTFAAGLRADTKGSTAAYAGSRRNGSDMMIAAWRLNQLGATTAINETAATPFTIAADGSGSAGAAKLGLGAGGNLLVTATVNPLLDPSGYEISFASASTALTGTGVYINPLGIINAASLAPPLDAVSPGQYIAIYGSGLAAAAAPSAAPPFPTALGGVTVTIGGIAAPLYYVGPGQINCVVPYGVTGATVDIVVKNGSVASNTVTVALANTAPGIFTQDGGGTHDGAITHLDYTLVNAASPAKKGETVSMYLTGLGALTTPVNDGYGATAVDFAKTQLQVLVDGIPATIQYSGLSSLPGLYQINFQIPSTLAFSGEVPVAILTPDAFNDQATIAVQ